MSNHVNPILLSWQLSRCFVNLFTNNGFHEIEKRFWKNHKTSTIIIPEVETSDSRYRVTQKSHTFSQILCYNSIIELLEKLKRFVLLNFQEFSVTQLSSFRIRKFLLFIISLFLWCVFHLKRWQIQLLYIPLYVFHMNEFLVIVRILVYICICLYITWNVGIYRWDRM